VLFCLFIFNLYFKIINILYHKPSAVKIIGAGGAQHWGPQRQRALGALADRYQFYFKFYYYYLVLNFIKGNVKAWSVLLGIANQNIGKFTKPRVT